MANGNWIYQGRQYHQWFGHGTAPTSGDGAAPAALDDRITVLGATTMASFPASQRHHATLQPGRAWHGPFQKAMRALVAVRLLSPERFAETMLGMHADAPGASDLQASAVAIASATKQRDMWAASDHLATGMKALTLDHWPRFIASAASRAASVPPEPVLVPVQYTRGRPPGSGTRPGGLSMDNLTTAEIVRLFRYKDLATRILEVEPANPTALGWRQQNSVPTESMISALEREWLMVQQRSNPQPFQTPGELIRPSVLNPAGAARNAPGTVHTSTELPVAGPHWLEQCYRDGAPVPAQVARAMDGHAYQTFGEFRRAFWQTVEKVPELARQFSDAQRQQMRDGYAPAWEELTQTVGPRQKLELDHVAPIAGGGPVYDMSNIRIVTPRVHIDRHREGVR